MADACLSFKEKCAQFDVTPRTLRYYEYIEMLSPEKEGRARFCGAREVARMTLTLRGRRFGFSLEEIRQFLDMYHRDDSNEAQLTRTYELAQARLAQMEAQRADLDLAIAELKTQMAEGSATLAAFRSTAE